MRVRVPLDEQLPRQLSAYLVGHEVRTVQEQRWAGTKNGELLRLAAETGFESFLTADHNLEYQQNLQAVSLGIVVLVAAINALEDLLPSVPDPGQPAMTPSLPPQPTSGLDPGLGETCVGD